MTISEAAKMIGCTTQTVLNLIERDALVGVGSDKQRRTYVSRESVVKFCNVYPGFSKQYKAVRSLIADYSHMDLLSRRMHFSLKEEVIDNFAKTLLPSEDYNIFCHVSSDGFNADATCEKLGITKTGLEHRVRAIEGTLSRKLDKYDNVVNAILSSRFCQRTNESTVLPDNLMIDKLGFSQHTQSSLAREGITSLNQVTQYTRMEFLSLRTIGRKTLREIEERMNELGLKFAEKPRR